MFHERLTEESVSDDESDDDSDKEAAGVIGLTISIGSGFPVGTSGSSFIFLACFGWITLAAGASAVAAAAGAAGQFLGSVS